MGGKPSASVPRPYKGSQACGLKKSRFHALRHTAASLLATSETMDRLLKGERAG